MPAHNRQPPTPTSVRPAATAPHAGATATGRKLQGAQRTARRPRNYTAPSGQPISPTGARTPAATPSYAANATSVRVAPRWAGSHWATGRNAKVTSYRTNRTTPALPLATVRSRGMYGY